MGEEKQLTEIESLRIISEMILKAKNEFYETGVSALLWGSVVSFCGLYSFIADKFNWPYLNEVWYLTFLAIIPQIVILIIEGGKHKAKQHLDGVGAAWITFAITMIGMTMFLNIVPHTYAGIFKAKHLELILHNTQTGTSEMISPFYFKASTLYFLVYAFPTLITGIGRCFNPMKYGALICYMCFVVSCYSSHSIDFLLQAIAAISCWLVPGLILHNRYRKAKKANV